MVEENIKNKINVLGKHFLETKDIAILLDCGLTKAREYRKRFIKNRDYQEDYFLFEILTSEFVDFYKIDVERLTKLYISITGGNEFVN